MTWTCEQVLKQIERHRLNCTPQVFHVLYVALTEPSSKIAKELVRLEENGIEVTLGTLDFLYGAYLSPDQEAARCINIVQSSQARTSAVTTSAEVSQNLVDHLFTCAESAIDETPLRETVLQIRPNVQEHLDNIIMQTKALDAELRACQKELFTDALSGVPNRRFLEAELNKRLEAHDTSLHIALIDIDHFKNINDEHGHILGDHTIRVVARLIQSQLRSKDVLCRYGGEEFCVLFYDTDTNDCVAVLEAIRSEIARRTIFHNRSGKSFGPITISAGLAKAQPGDDVEAAIHRADEQMYRSKSDGRNRVSC